MKTTIDMAREAGFAITVSTDPNSPPSWWTAGHDDRFKAFADLVRADEREACAKVCDWLNGEKRLSPAGCAAAIRARGNT
jgi:hypothetical protein